MTSVHHITMFKYLNVQIFEYLKRFIKTFAMKQDKELPSLCANIVPHHTEKYSLTYTN